MKYAALEGTWLHTLSTNWWLFAIRGVFALLFSLSAFFAQRAAFSIFLRAFTFASVVVIFGVLTFFAGLATLIAGIRGIRKDHGAWLLLGDGLATCIAGVVVVAAPELTLIYLIRLVSYWALFMGTSELLLAIRLRKHLLDERFMAAAGTGSLVFGIILLVGRIPTLTAMLGWLSIYSLFSAVTIFGLAFRLRSLEFEAPDTLATHA